MTDDEPGRDGPSRLRSLVGGRFRWPARVVAVLMGLALVLTGIAAVDVALLSHRIRHVGIDFPLGGTGETFLVIGSDSRAGAPRDKFGSTVEVPGQRADVVLLVHRASSGRTSMVSVPRDLTVILRSGAPRRLALTLLTGPQAVVDGVCRTLGVAADHVVIVDFGAFTDIVDIVGGIYVTTPAPLRDAQAGLELWRGGRQRLTGAQALALVRSRHPERLVDGQWTPVADGTGQRTEWAGVVFDAIAVAARAARTHPWTLNRLAWTVTGSLTTDSGTGLRDLYRLAGAQGKRVDLPSQVLQPAGNPLPPSSPDYGSLPRTATAQTFATLAAAGFGRDCRTSA